MSDRMICDNSNFRAQLEKLSIFVFKVNNAISPDLLKSNALELTSGGSCLLRSFFKTNAVAKTYNCAKICAYSCGTYSLLPIDTPLFLNSTTSNGSSKHNALPASLIELLVVKLPASV